MEIDIRRADERFVSGGDGTATRHSFSFGTHYDPLNLGFGLLVCHDEHTLQPSKGYDEHPHRDLEIVTWMLEGELHHRDSTGHTGVVVPGEVQVLGAGAGVLHEEHAGSGATRFVQMWVRPDETGLPPRYLQQPLLPGDEWAVVPGVRSSRAALYATRLRSGSTTTLPVAPYVHLFVCRGVATLGTGEVVGAGDAVRVTDSEGIDFAGDFTGDAEVLAWAMR